MALSRNQEHYVIMTVIYNELTDFIYGDKANVRDAEELIKGVSLSQYGEEYVSEYSKNTVFISLSKYGEIVKEYEPYLKGWKWDRIPALTRAILLMSYSHFYYVEKVDKRIIINIAVNLAKLYVDEKQAKFVNGLLDGVLK